MAFPDGFGPLLFSHGVRFGRPDAKGWRYANDPTVRIKKGRDGLWICWLGPVSGVAVTCDGAVHSAWRRAHAAHQKVTL